jgi:hypothetical protein
MPEIVERQSLLRMEKFGAVLETISEQITLQTKMLADMIEISMDQFKINQETKEREKARQQREDLADAQEEDRDEPDDVSPPRAEREGPGLFSMLGGMGLSKLLIGGALLGGGLFAAYNIAKGFIDEMYNGAWSKFEDGLVNLVNSIDWDGLKESLSKLPDAIDNFLGFLNNPITYILGAAAGTILTSLAGGAIMRTLFGPRRGGLLNSAGTSPVTPRASPGTPRAAPTRSFGNFNPDGTVSGPGQAARPNMGARAAVAGAMPGQYRLANNGRALIGPDGKFVSNDKVNQLIDDLEKNLRTSSPRFAGIFKALTKGLVVAGVAFMAVDVYRIYMILSDPNGNYASDQDKINAIGPIIGPLVTSAGAAVLGAVIGGYVGGPWGALIGGASAAIAAGFLTPQQFGIYLASAIFNVRPTEEQRRAIAVETESRASRVDGFTPFTVAPSPAPAPTGAPTGVTSVPPRPTGSGRNVRAAQMAWDRQYGSDLVEELPNSLYDEATSDREYKRGTKGFQDFGPASFAVLHGREAVVPEETPAGRFLSQFFNEDWSPKMSRANLTEEVSTVASGGTGTALIVNHNTNIAPVTHNLQGGPNVSATTIVGSGGGDRSRDPYGITNGAN